MQIIAFWDGNVGKATYPVAEEEGHWSLVIGHWGREDGHWALGIGGEEGCWLLVAGCSGAEVGVYSSRITRIRADSADRHDCLMIRDTTGGVIATARNKGEAIS